MKAAYPSGNAIAIPVEMSPLPPPGSSTACSAAKRSHPASPGCAYFGRGKSASSLLIGTLITKEA